MSHAPWIKAQRRQLLSQRGHAWLLHGPSGLGQYDLAIGLAQAWLCDHPIAEGACQACGSCHAVTVRTHADLCMLMPETTMSNLGWPLSEKAQSDIDDKKRKASKEIRIDAMRDAVEFAQRTSARGRGKVVLVFPAEQMNNITANALLKTLEEPPGDVKFVLASESAHQLLPTIRSRCLGHTMEWPNALVAIDWLVDKGIPAAHASFLLSLAAGRPDDALNYAASGRNPHDWAAFPEAISRGDTSFVREWTAPQLIDGLQKLCHDLLAKQVGAAPRFFSDSQLKSTAPTSVLSIWGRSLSTATKTMDHPFNPGLMLEALVGHAQQVLNSKS